MNVSNFIAKRYLFAKKSRNIINLISFISFLGLLVSSASLVIILSGFNGIQQYVEDVYGKFAADLYAFPKNGNIINKSDSIYQFLETDQSVINYSKIIEETALLKFENRWVTTLVKGIDEKNYRKSKWGNNLLDGKAEFLKKGLPSILLGYGIQNELQIPYSENITNEIKIYSISKKVKLSIQNKEFLNQHNLIFGGVYTINPELDQNTAMISYQVASEIFDLDNGANYLELYTNSEKSLSKLKQQLSQSNPQFTFKTHEENNQLIYAANDAEKWMVLAVLIFVLILSSFTVVASITMLIIDKKKDINSLVALGANKRMIKDIFFKEGLMISFLGSIGGLIIGILVCVVQIKFHVLKLENASISYWPVLIKLDDIIMLVIILFTTGLIASFLPGKLLIHKLLNS